MACVSWGLFFLYKWPYCSGRQSQELKLVLYHQISGQVVWPQCLHIVCTLISCSLSSVYCPSWPCTNDTVGTCLGYWGDAEFGLSVELFVVQFGGAARLSNLAHVATFVFIWPARRKFLPKMKGNTTLIMVALFCSCMSVVIKAIKRNHSGQSQSSKIIQGINQNLKQIIHLPYTKHGKTCASTKSWLFFGFISD